MTLQLHFKTNNFAFFNINSIGIQFWFCTHYYSTLKKWIEKAGRWELFTLYFREFNTVNLIEPWKQTMWLFPGTISVGLKMFIEIRYHWNQLFFILMLIGIFINLFVRFLLKIVDRNFLTCNKHVHSNKLVKSAIKTGVDRTLWKFNSLQREYSSKWHFRKNLEQRK